MKPLLLMLFVILFSCTNEVHKTSVVLDMEGVNSEVIKSLEESEKALLSWYLYAYGNFCTGESSKIKCLIMNDLKVKDECDPQHLNNLLGWFSKDMLAVYKLNACPNLQSNSAIQNEFDKLILIKKGDTLSIEYSIKGLNNSEEKSWNFNNTDSYLITGKTLVKLN